MIGGRWIRLDCDFLLTAWLDAVGYPAKLIWPVIVAHVEQTGNRKGIARAVPARVLSRMYDLNESDVQALIAAAIASGELIEESGCWAIVRWPEYSDPSRPTQLRRAMREKAAGGRIPREVRLEVLSVGACIRCGATSRLTVDHILPLSKGGTNAIDNLQCLCKSCNSRKRNNT